jgi:hypothetical protein
MTRDTLRVMARNRWPVVLTETGAHGEIVYPFIREIKVIYASGDEISRGFPLERLAVVLADRSGHSFTEVRAAQLRLPTPAEAAPYMGHLQPWGRDEQQDFEAELARLRAKEETS